LTNFSLFFFFFFFFLFFFLNLARSLAMSGAPGDRERADSETLHELEMAASLGSALVAKNAALERSHAALTQRARELEERLGEEHDARLGAEAGLDTARARLKQLLADGVGASFSAPSTDDGDGDGSHAARDRASRARIQRLEEALNIAQQAARGAVERAEAAEQRLVAERRSTSRLEGMVADLNAEIDIRCRRALDAQAQADARFRARGEARVLVFFFFFFFFFFFCLLLVFLGARNCSALIFPPLPPPFF
jgi:hypothetical protein